MGYTYRLRFRAKNINGWSDYSPITSILAASKPDSPYAPPTLVSSTSTTITLSFTPSIQANGSPIISNGYKLYQDGGTLSSSYTAITGYNGQSSTYTVTGLIQGTSYRFYYTATNSKGESLPSDYSRYAAADKPAIPTGLTMVTST